MGIGFYGLGMSKGAVSLLQHASKAVLLTRCLLTRKSGSRGNCVPRCWLQVAYVDPADPDVLWRGWIPSNSCKLNSGATDTTADCTVTAGACASE